MAAGTDANALLGEGIALADQAWTMAGSEANDFIARAEQKFQAALAISPNDPVTLCAWGRALGRLAQTKTGSERAHLFGLAAGKFQDAHMIKPEEPDILRGWGAALTAQAMATTGTEADSLYVLAEERFLAALQINYDLRSVRVWGQAVAAQAKTKFGQESNLLEEKGILLRKEADAPGSAAYRLAHVAARHGPSDECCYWLEVCHRHGNLPPRSKVERDPAFEQVLARVRGRVWFRELLDQFYL